MSRARQNARGSGDLRTSSLLRGWVLQTGLSIERRLLRCQARPVTRNPSANFRLRHAPRGPTTRLSLSVLIVLVLAVVSAVTFADRRAVLITMITSEKSVTVRRMARANSLPAHGRGWEGAARPAVADPGERWGVAVATSPLLLLPIHLLCCTLARLTIRVDGATAVALALPKQKTHKTATLARHRLHRINELRVLPFFFLSLRALLLSFITSSLPGCASFDHDF